VVVWKLLKICLQWKICSGQTPMKTQNLERNIINHVKWNQRITSFFFLQQRQHPIESQVQSDTMLTRVISDQV